MEHYNKEKHYGLVLEHIKKAALECRELDMHSRYDNYGNALVELFINETESIIIRNEDFCEICNEVYAGSSYHQAMIDYIASVDERSKIQLIFNSLEHHDTTSLDNIQCRSFLNQIK
jgi:hypothetical protein